MYIPALVACSEGNEELLLSSPLWLPPWLFGFIWASSWWRPIVIIRLASPTPSDLSSFTPAEEFLLLLGIFLEFFGIVIY